MNAPIAFLGDFADAFEFIFSERQGSGGADVGGLNNLDLLWEHLKLSVAGMALALAVALPVGLYLGHANRFQFLAISVSNVGRAVPSLAIIAMFIAFFSFGEFTNLTLALALLAIPPVLTNAYVGVRQVPRETVDAAKGMGMTGLEIIRRVELPLALPLIMGGVKTSAVNVVATVTIAPLAGIVTLGDPIINVNTYGDEGRLAAAIMVAALAVLTEVGLTWLQKAVTPEGLKLAGGGRLRRRFPLRRVETLP